MARRAPDVLSEPAMLPVHQLEPTANQCSSLHCTPHLDVNIINSETARLLVSDREYLRQYVCAFRGQVLSPCLGDLSLTDCCFANSICCHDGFEDFRYCNTAVQNDRSQPNRRHCDDRVQRHSSVHRVDVASVVDAVFDESKWVAEEDRSNAIK